MHCEREVEIPVTTEVAPYIIIGRILKILYSNTRGLILKFKPTDRYNKLFNFFIGIV
jgi:hypothetical protein